MLDLNTQYLYKSAKGYQLEVIEPLDEEPNQQGLIRANFLGSYPLHGVPARGLMQTANVKRIKGTVAEHEAELAKEDADRPLITYTDPDGKSREVKNFRVNRNHARILNTLSGTIAFTEDGERSIVPLSEIKIEETSDECELCGAHESIVATFASPATGKKIEVNLWEI